MIDRAILVKDREGVDAKILDPPLVIHQAGHCLGRLTCLQGLVQRVFLVSAFRLVHALEYLMIRLSHECFLGLAHAVQNRLVHACHDPPGVQKQYLLIHLVDDGLEHVLGVQQVELAGHPYLVRCQKVDEKTGCIALHQRDARRQIVTQLMNQAGPAGGLDEHVDLRVIGKHLLVPGIGGYVSARIMGLRQNGLARQGGCNNTNFLQDLIIALLLEHLPKCQ